MGVCWGWDQVQSNEWGKEGEVGMLCGTHSIWLGVKGGQPQGFCCRAGSEDWMDLGEPRQKDLGEPRQKKTSADSLSGFMPVGSCGLAGDACWGPVKSNR